MANGTEGVAKFFAGIGAGPALRQRAAAQGRLDAMRTALLDAQIGNTQADAGIKQVKLDALDPATLAAAFSGAGVPEAQASGAAGLARAGNNADQIAGMMKVLQGLAIRRDARDAAVRGDLNGANANLFGVADKPVTLSQVTDGVALDPTVTPDANAFDPTAVGQAMINQRNAAAGNSAASVAATNAKLPMELVKLAAEATKAKAGGTGKLPPISDVTAILPKAISLDNPMAAPAAKPEDVATVLSWLAQHPGGNVGQYVGQAPVGSPGALPPQGATAVPTGPMPADVADVLAGTGAAGGLPAAAAPATVAPTSGPSMPASKEAFDALPAGALFINPADGRLMRKK